MAIGRFNYDEVMLLHHALLRPEKSFVKKYFQEMETEELYESSIIDGLLEKIDSLTDQEMHELFMEVLEAPMPYL